MIDAFTPQFDEAFLEKYTVLKRIGEGGMGTVYRAVQRDLGREVAVKCIIPAISGGFEASDIARFKREARVLTEFRHPNIVEVYDFGISTTPYLVIEYLEGQSLRDYLDNKGSLPLKEALPLAKQILAGIEHAHQNKVLHRDLKPGNIFCTHDGTVKLLDFGLAKKEDQKTQITVTGTGVGTPYYCSVEQMQGDPLTPASDLFSFGIVFYEMLSGRLPYRNDTFDGVYHEKLTGNLLSIKLAAKRQLPPRVVTVIDSLLHPDPDVRPTIGEVVEALWAKKTTAKEERASAKTAPRPELENAVPLNSPPPPELPKGRRPFFIVALIIAIVCALSYLAFSGETSKQQGPGKVEVELLQGTAFSLKLKISSVHAGRLFLSVKDKVSNSPEGKTRVLKRAKGWTLLVDRLKANREYVIAALVRDERKDWRKEIRVCTKDIKFRHTKRCFIGKSPFRLIKGPGELVAIGGEDQVIACIDLAKENPALWSTWKSKGGGMWMRQDKTHLYGVALNFMLRAYKWRSGEISWQRQLNPKTNRLFYVVDGTLVFLTKREGLLALDSLTGKEKWRLDGIDLTVPWVICGDSVLVPSRMLDFFRLDLQTGKQKDLRAFLGGAKRAPVAYLCRNDELYFASDPIIGSKDNLLIGKLDGKPRLAIDVPGHIASLAADEKRVYVYTNAPVGLYAFSQEDGQQLWKVQAEEIGKREFKNLLIHKSELFLAARSGQLKIVAKEIGKVLWSTEEKLLVSQSPIVKTSQGVLLLFSDGTLRLFGQ